MKKIINISIIFTLIILFFIPYVKASSVTMNLTTNEVEIQAENQNTFEEENIITNTTSNTTTNTSSNTTPVSNTPAVTKTTSDSEEFLTTENILSIIIIVIGIILVFLGIAIIIRCR